MDDKKRILRHLRDQLKHIKIKSEIVGILPLPWEKGITPFLYIRFTNKYSTIIGTVAISVWDENIRISSLGGHYDFPLSDPQCFEEVLGIIKFHPQFWSPEKEKSNG